MLIRGRSVAALIFDWDGVFVDSELLKAWTYGRGIHEVCSRFAAELPADIGTDFPARTADLRHPFVQVCGRWVGRAREEYAGGLVAHYRLASVLNQQLDTWTAAASAQLELLREERRKNGLDDRPPFHPYEVLYELRRPYYEQVRESIAPITANIEFRKRLPPEVKTALVTRTHQPEVESAMQRFGIPAFSCMVCRPQKSVSKADMYQEVAGTLDLSLRECAAIEDTQVGIEAARSARSRDGCGMGVVIACPTGMTWVQFPDVVLDAESPDRWQAIG